MPAKKKTYSIKSLNNEAELLEVAEKLKAFIEENNLLSIIERVNKKTGEVSSKAYATVESWLYAGSLLNLRAIPGEAVNISTEKEIRYSCTVEIFDVSGDTPILVSRGKAICGSSEGFFKWAKEFSICSMSQTRAVGKAYRIIIGHLLKVAGLEATPAEEMTEVKGDKNSDSGSLIDKEALLDLIKFTLDRCTSTSDVKKLASPLGELAKDKEIRPVLGAAYKELDTIEKELRAEQEAAKQEEDLNKEAIGDEEVREALEQIAEKEVREETPEELEAIEETDNRISNN